MTVDESGFSGHTIDGVQFTWKQLYEREHDETIRLTQLASILADLDRCEHGRHEGDTCFDCNGPSHGNPFLPWPRPHLGYTMSGAPIVYPCHGNTNLPEDWIEPRL